MSIGDLGVTDDLSWGSFRDCSRAAQTSSHRRKEEVDTGRSLVCHILLHSVAGRGVLMMSAGRTGSRRRKASDS